MKIDLVLAKREYVLEKGITDKAIINQIIIVYQGTNKRNEAVFTVYPKKGGNPVSWALVKYDARKFKGNKDYWLFPKEHKLTPLSVANFINQKINIGIKPDDIAYISESKKDRWLVMISLDSMYFTHSFILRTA